MPTAKLTVFAAAVGTIAVPATGLAEGSGLAASAHRPGVVWVVEDSGEPITRAFAADGSAAGSVTLDGWNNRDTEALASGPDGTLWVADIGDNRAVRDSVVVHVVAEPSDDADVRVVPTSYRIVYPDGPRDAEAFLVDPVTGGGYVVSKMLADAQIYALPADLTPGETHEVVPVAAAPPLVTDGAFTPDGARIILRDYFAAFVYDVERGPDGSLAGLGEPSTLDLPAQAQGESIAVTPDGATVLVGSEGPDEPIHAVDLPPAGEADQSTGGTDAPGTSTPRSVTGPTTSPNDTDPTTAPPVAEEIADGVLRGLSPVGATLVAMAGIAALGTAGWLIWIRSRRSRGRSRRAGRQRRET